MIAELEKFRNFQNLTIWKINILQYQKSLNILFK